MQWHSGKLQAQQCEKIKQQGVAEKVRVLVSRLFHLVVSGPCFDNLPPLFIHLRTETRLRRLLRR